MIRALVLLLLVGCSATPDPSVAFIVTRSDDLAALRAATPDLRSVGFIAADAATLHAHVDRALELGVRVLVVEPVDDPDATAIITRAHERGARIVAFGTELGARADGDTIDALVAFDGYRAGTEHAAAAVAALGTGRFALLVDRDATGFAAEVARGYVHTLAPYIARNDITIVDDVTTADAVLAVDGHRVRSLTAGPTFIASASGDNVDLLCAGRQQLDVRFDRAALAAAAGLIVKRFVAGEDLDKDPRTIRLPGRRLPVELAFVTTLDETDCE